MSELGLSGKRVLIVVNYGNGAKTLTGVMHFVGLNFSKIAVELTDDDGKRHIINWDHIIEIQPLE